MLSDLPLADIVSCIAMSAGEILRSARTRHRVSQRSLALRAGTTQAWISAIERGRAQPTVDMLRRLLMMLGEELVLESRPLPSDAQHDPIAFAHARSQAPGERVEDALRWMADARP